MNRRPNGWLFCPILIVTGSEIRAEEMDRPLAYRIRDGIRRAPEADMLPSIYVISDYRYMYEAALQECPAISVGGCGVNALSHKWLKEIPFTVRKEDEYYIQETLNDPKCAPRASIWGIDHQTTRIAVQEYINNHLDNFLLHCLPPTPDSETQPANRLLIR